MCDNVTVRMYGCESLCVCVLVEKGVCVCACECGKEAVSVGPSVNKNEGG